MLKYTNLMASLIFIGLIISFKTHFEVRKLAFDEDLNGVALVESLDGSVFLHDDYRLVFLKTPRAGSTIVQDHLVLWMII
jgi:hypothetical protein